MVRIIFSGKIKLDIKLPDPVIELAATHPPSSLESYDESTFTTHSTPAENRWSVLARVHLSQLSSHVRI
jgi:hypothetical protein